MVLPKPLDDLMAQSDREMFQGSVFVFGDWTDTNGVFGELRLYEWTCSICSDFVTVLDTGGYRICFDCVGMLRGWHENES